MITRRLKPKTAAENKVQNLKDGFHSVWVHSIAETRTNGHNTITITFKNNQGISQTVLPVNKNVHDVICKIGSLSGGKSQEFRLSDLIDVHLDIEVIYSKAKYFAKHGELTMDFESL